MASLAPAKEQPLERQSRPTTLFIYLALILFGIVMVTPFFWLVSTACKSATEINQIPIRWLPAEALCTENLRSLYQASPNFNRYLLNTGVVTVVRVVGQLFFCTLAAYGFARFKFPGRNIIFTLLLAILMVPYHAVIIPQFLLVNALGLRDTLAGIFLPNLFSAFTLFLLRQAFLQTPIELEEAAEIDGANPLQTLWLVTLPLIRPTLAAATVIGVQAAWNDFLWPLVISASESTRVVTLGIAILQTNSRNPANIIMMASLIATLPMIVIFLLMQRHFIRGVASSGLKG